MRSRAEVWRPVADELREKPGESGVILEAVADGTASSLASMINAGLLDPWSPPGTFRATSRKVDSLTVVYARYVGDDTDE